MARFDDSVRAEDVERGLKRLSRTPPEVAMAVVATIANGWPTDRRLQVPTIRQCLFGCTGPNAVDALDHYACCPALWGGLADAASPAVVGSARFALGAPLASRFEAEKLARRVAAALHAYRTVRLSPSIASCGSEAALQVARIRATTAAAHKFEVARSERFGTNAPDRSRGSRRNRRNTNQVS